MPVTTERILGYPVSAKSCADSTAEIMSWLEGSGHGCYVATANPHSLVIAEDDAEFKAALLGADLLVPDGIGIVLASMIYGGGIRQRVTGSDIFFSVSRAMNDRGKGSVFFLGTTDATLEKIRLFMSRDYPAIRVAGTYSPPFRERFSGDECAAMIDAVNAAKPDILWVGMTAPKQEKWVHENRSRLRVKCIGAIGALFDFYAGNVKRSHPFFQRLGLEWLPRLLQEPRRLWRRNFVSSPLFLLRVIVDRIGLTRKGVR